MKKSVLMLVPSVFSYDVMLNKSLNRLVEDSITFNERPGNSFVMKAGLRLNKKPVSFLLTYSYYKKIQKVIEDNDIEKVLIINPEATPLWFLKYLRKKNKTILIYFWDSFINKPRNESLLPYATKAWSFDPEDAKQYNLTYKPLFYSKEQSSEVSYKYKLAFIGTLHSDRYELVNQVFLPFSNEQVFKFFYCPSKLMFFYKKYIQKSWSHINENDVSFEPLSYSESMKVLSESEAILDIHNSSQRGLTMRTIETLGNGQKLITTNDSIVNEPFYDERFMMYFDRNSQSTFEEGRIRKFVGNKNDELLDMKAYFINNWLRELVMYKPS